ncbi:MAG: hypothetical protein JNG88_12375 [Phycisphaerales bacterium]|nr:hypothetical protein [Phycisphaerales bacterium]
MPRITCNGRGFSEVATAVGRMRAERASLGVVVVIAAYFTTVAAAQQPKIVDPQVVSSGCETLDIADEGTEQRVAFGAAGLLSASNRAVRIWNEQTHEAKATKLDNRGTAGGEPLLFDRTGTQLVTRSGDSIDVWDLQSGKRKTQLPARYALQFNNDGTVLLAQDERHEIALHFSQPGRPPARVGSSKERLVLSPPPTMTADAAVILAQADDKNVILYDMKSGKRYRVPDLVGPWPAENAAKPTLAAWRFSDDKQTLFVCAMAQVPEHRKEKGRTIQIQRNVQVFAVWNTKDLVTQELADADRISDKARASDNTKCRPRMLLQCARRTSVHDVEIAISSDGQLVALVDDSGASLWDVKRKHILGVIDPPGGGHYSNGAFANDGSRLALGLHVTHFSIAGDDPKAVPGRGGLAARGTAHIQLWKTADLRKLFSSQPKEKP